jgi:hypothetical protein
VSVKVRVKLIFPEQLVREPVLARLVKDHDVEPNIRKANVDDGEGWILCEIGGEPDNVESALSWLRSVGVEVDLLGDVIEG